MLSGATARRKPDVPMEQTSDDHHRWDAPFGRNPIRSQIVASILSIPAFKAINPRDFPDDLPLAKIISHDGRILQLDRNEVIYKQGDHGDSVFVLLRGGVRCVTLPEESETAQTGSAEVEKAWFSSLPDFSDSTKKAKSGLFGRSKSRRRSPAGQRGVILSAYDMFGISSALRRAPREDTAFACEDKTFVLELRWPGVRDLRFWSSEFNALTDKLYNVASCLSGLRQCPLFRTVDDLTLEVVAKNATFETYGKLGWSHAFQNQRTQSSGNPSSEALEPAIVEQGEPFRGLLVVTSGIVRVSHRIGNGELTVGFLTKGDVFGLEQLIAGLTSDESLVVENGLKACGYANVIAIPQDVVETCLRPDPETLESHQPMKSSGNVVAHGSDIAPPLLDFIVDNRFVNGTSAMVINTDRCVNCDDCVRACAATHDNIPRFVRKGKSHHRLMVANACMHCTDPVCMVDCPTAAIHRNSETGNVLIDHDTCIGCGTCASACPYDNIRMEKALDPKGTVYMGQDGFPALKAIKCDLCAGQNNGPACKRACPHDAIDRIDFSDSEMLSDWLKVSQ